VWGAGLGIDTVLPAAEFEQSGGKLLLSHGVTGVLVGTRATEMDYRRLLNHHRSTTRWFRTVPMIKHIRHGPCAACDAAPGWPLVLGCRTRPKPMVISPD
jgi:hypothetical protein|tara:strand:- start:277 stop:576 length:300 start_codon:yes stop_codon:yes gene_type:complete